MKYQPSRSPLEPAAPQQLCNSASSTTNQFTNSGNNRLSQSLVGSHTHQNVQMAQPTQASSQKKLVGAGSSSVGGHSSQHYHRQQHAAPFQ